MNLKHTEPRGHVLIPLKTFTRDIWHACMPQSHTHTYANAQTHAQTHTQDNGSLHGETIVFVQPL